MAQIFTLQGKIAVTNTSQQLPNNPLITQTITISAKAGNTAAIVIVNSATASTATDGTGAGLILTAGTSVTIYGILNTNALYVSGTANDVYSGIAT